MFAVIVTALSACDGASEEELAAQQEESFASKMAELDREQEAAEALWAAKDDAREREYELQESLAEFACEPPPFDEMTSCSLSLPPEARVIDGDTLEFHSERIRLPAVDAPEMRPEPECGAVAAKARLRQLVLELVDDGYPFLTSPSYSSWPKRDRYGRRLLDLTWIGERAPEGDELVAQPVVVYAGVVLAQEGLVRWRDYSAANGMSRAEYFRTTEIYRQATARARTARRGGWGTCGWR